MLTSKSSESASKRGILAGAVLAAIEVAGGLLSGSLGLLSSSFNTLMDFLAAIIMFFAVRESSKPPDEVHMYGHEKIESAAAISEIMLLVLACSWIVYSAYLRIMSNEQKIEFFWVAFLTNFASISIDLFAYLNLKASTKKQRSEAIEAGALHFLNDLLIAVIVIVGLIFYWFGVWIADSIAALCIVAYVLFSGSKIIRESYATLTDAAPQGISNKVKEQILSVEGVSDCHHLRIRRAGAKFFVDAHITLAGGMTLYQAHSVTSIIEERVSKILPHSDIMIHTEPHTGKDPVTTVRTIASHIPEIKGIHEITVETIGGKLLISYHIELESKITITSAHEIANSLEQRIKEELKNVSTIISHLEPAPETARTGYSREPDKLLEKEVARISQSMPEVRSLHEIEILAREERYNVTLHCEVDSSVTLAQAHEIATKIEEKIKAVDNRIDQVSVHCEPQETA
jgi:cation diffusion facilitator family transporter